MASALAFLRQDFLSATSYRVNMALSVVGLLAMIVPVYFVAEALQPTMADSIEGQGGDYFTFLLVGLVASRLLLATLGALPSSLHKHLRTGTLEVLFSTPARLTSLLSGMMSYRVLWSVVEGALMLGFGALFGAQFALGHAANALLIVGLIVLAYVPFGLMAAAALISFRTTLRMAVLVGSASALLGGVYYPTEVIPSWLGDLSAVIPVTYGLRALRKTFLEGMPLTAVAGDLLILGLFAVSLMVVAAFLFGRALDYARTTGGLAQY